MPSIERFGVSIEDELLTWFDGMVEAKGYGSRSEAIRDLIRGEMVKAEWENPDAEVVGTVTIVYEHHVHELANVMAEVQHRHHGSIICSTHIHLDAHNCLEVIIVKGRSSEVREIANALTSTRGVKHGQLVCSSTGKTLV